jgi:hypothetical protein
VLLAACDGASDATAVDAALDAAPFTPDTCDGMPLELYGNMTDPTTQPTYGPVTLDTTGITICMTLDARNNGNLAHFSATTQYETANASSFELALFDASDASIEMGWDVAIGSSPATTFANLEHSFERGQVYAVKLVARAKAAPAPAQIALRLFCPLE